MKAKTRDNNRMTRVALMRASTRIEGRKLERVARTREEYERIWRIANGKVDQR